MLGSPESPLAVVARGWLRNSLDLVILGPLEYHGEGRHLVKIQLRGRLGGSSGTTLPCSLPSSLSGCSRLGDPSRDCQWGCHPAVARGRGDSSDDQPPLAPHPQHMWQLQRSWQLSWGLGALALHSLRVSPPPHIASRSLTSSAPLCGHVSPSSAAPPSVTS